MRCGWFGGLLVCVLLECGCSLLSGKQELMIQGGGFRNLTDYEIRNAELRVESTLGVVSCSYIAPQGYFGTTFPLRNYQQNPIEVSWRYRGQKYTSGKYVIPLPEPLPDEPVVAVIRFHAEGRVTSRFIPVSEIPSRDRR